MRARNITFGAKIKARWPPKRSELTGIDHSLHQDFMQDCVF